MSNLSAAYFHDPDAAREHLEKIRWPDGSVCPHCGEIEKVYKVKSKKVRSGVHLCGNKHCRKQFTVTVGTLFEGSHVPLNKWFQAAYLLCSSKKGMSSHQLHRILGVTYKTAWFMAHRLREALKDGPIFKEPIGGAGMTVEADETYLGGKKRGKNKDSLQYERNMLIADQFQEPTFSEAGYISETYELINEFSGHNPDPADPWLIAAAKTHGMTVVTDERRNSPKRIPHVCEERDVRCKSRPEFLAEVGIV